ncbi:putative E3 ubiquitin-protein ligase HERC6 isoform X2 [Macrotis lagotis]|uniref:putative E3 ubiquitin-protein ligase HERC6 isoform X2 n=1 Tax=Macrotis lagotis TaxID=92651 RepID=UPI003D693368
MYYCWGDNSCGQLGGPAAGGAGALRCRRGGGLGGRGLRQAACGERHSLLLLAGGGVWACGSNSRGQLGARGARACGGPAPIQALENQVVVFVSCGKEHSLAISKTGSVFSWGAGSEGQLGIGEFKKQNFIPKKIEDLSGIKIIQVSCGHYHSIALAQDGRVFSWGNNLHGQLGLGEIFPSQASPQQVKSLDGIPLAQVAAGGAHSFALSLSGISYGWGRNNEGQLAVSGKNALEQIYKPHSIAELKSLHVIYISCGDEHTAVLTQDGKVFTFGSNNSGQLGHRLVSKKSGPQIVDSENLFSQIACGSHHTLAYSCTTGQVVSFGCGSQRDLKSQPGNLQENFNISNLISFSDFTDVGVKDIFAGANANFVTTIQSKDVSSSGAPGRSLQQINHINQTLIKKWTTVKIGSKEYEESKREICEIFSHSACLTASFLKKRTDKTIPINIDLRMARKVFEELTQKDWITRMITSCLRDYLLKNLPLDTPHQEALSIFLLLPECPLMHTNVNWYSLVVPFAKAVCKMSDQSSTVLEKCWASLKKSSFNSLIQMLKQIICFQLQFGYDRNQDPTNTKALLEMLKKLHRVNKKANYKVPESAFHISELYTYLDFSEDLKVFYVFQKRPKFSDDPYSPVIFADFPFVFNLPSKIRILEENSLYSREVSFIGETNPESGGVRKEFFHCVFEEMIQSDYEMFMYSETSDLMWFPANPKFNEKNYFLFGILCGLSIVSFNVATLPFPLALYKKLLDQKPSLEDLQELSPELGNNLKLLLDENADEFHLYFSIYWDNKEVDLILNGSSIPVDETNKKDFVSRCIDYIFNTSVKTIYEAFQMGFYKVCAKKIIIFFHPEELKEVMIGNSDYDWKHFVANSEYYQGYFRLHPTIVMFWEAFHKLSQEEKKAFLLFLTGSDRFQAQCKKNVGIRFSYLEYLKEEYLPLVRSCDHVLFLPRYSTMERMEEALHMAIKNNKGFAH